MTLHDNFIAVPFIAHLKLASAFNNANELICDGFHHVIEKESRTKFSMMVRLFPDKYIAAQRFIQDRFTSLSRQCISFRMMHITKNNDAF